MNTSGNEENRRQSRDDEPKSQKHDAPTQKQDRQKPSKTGDDISTNSKAKSDKRPDEKRLGDEKEITDETTI